MGTYRWNGLWLSLKPEGGPPQVYSGYLRVDGKLILTHEGDGGAITAVLEKQADEKTAIPPKGTRRKQRP